jgi:2-methylcitrate dehydratase PrpD
MAEALTSVFAEFSSRLCDDDIPREVRRAARAHIVDSIGVSLAGASPAEESGVAARTLVGSWRATSGASVHGVDARCRPELAALLNGALAQALEMDDKHGSSLARPGSTVVPAVLAVAEANNLSLREATTAIVAGYEIMIRLGFVAGPRFLERGYHTSSLLGAFGAAVAIGQLLHLPPQAIADALGIAGSFAAGIQEATRTGSTSKILHGGWGAHSGILAVDFARAGITGPDSVFEGKFGFFNCFLRPISGALDFAAAADGIGRRWYLPETAFKPYPCCQLLHAFIEACKTIRIELHADGIPLSAIESIACRLAEPGLTLVNEPPDRKRRPTHPHEARFSLPYSVATTLVHGDVDVESFRPARLTETVVLDLAARVTGSDDPDSDYPRHCPARIEVRTAHKTYVRHVPFHPGSPEAPLLVGEVLDKFGRNTAWRLGDRARTIGADLMAAPDGLPVQEFVRVAQGAGAEGVIGLGMPASVSG